MQQRDLTGAPGEIIRRVLDRIPEPNNLFTATMSQSPAGGWVFTSGSMQADGPRETKSCVGMACAVVANVARIVESTAHTKGGIESERFESALSC